VADVETRPTDPPQEESDRRPSRGVRRRRSPRNPRRFRPYGEPETLDVGSHPRATLIGLVAVVVLFLFASFALGRLIADDENDAAVPRVTLPRYDNRPAADAQRSLEGMGMLVAIEYQGNEVLPPGTVFAQRPVAGAKVEEGDEVTLVVSSGPVGVAVPSVTGVPVSQAQALLTALGLTPEVRPTSHESVRPGEVIGSSPAAGTDAQPGSTVAILVSTGPAPRTVPAVVGQPGATGAAEIARAGLGIGPVTERHVAGTEPGLIIATDPAPGTQAPRDTPVSVVVSAPAESARAPALAGLLEATARTVASQGGFGISTRAQRLPAGDGRIGRVISQDIPPGTAVSPGLTLGVVVGVAPPPPPTTTTVPTTVPGAATTIAPGG